MLPEIRHRGMCLNVSVWLLAALFFLVDVKVLMAVGHPDSSALLGSSASLPCNITPPTSDDAVALVLWYRGGSGTPIFSLDARNTPPDVERTFVDDSLGSRVFFDRTGPVAMLRIERVQPVDDGEYRCRVDYKRSRTQNRIVRLSVVVPPAEVIITDKRGKLLMNSPIIGPYNEGSSLTLVCKALGGRPPPRVIWWRGPELVDDTYSTLADGIVGNDLVITKLKRTDLLATFRCEASNNNDTMPISVSVLLDLNLGPLDVRIVTVRNALLDGQLVDIECHAKGAQPQADIMWLLDGQPYNKSRSTLAVSASKSSSILYLEAKPDLNGRTVTCRGYNPYLEDSGLEDHWVLDVKYKPRLQLNMVTTGSNQRISEGTSVYFECNVQSNPPVEDVGWLHEGAQLNPTPEMRQERARLVIDYVRRHQRGNYQCAATNEMGRGVSENVFLMVYYAPKCSAGQKTVYYVAKHETVRVTCEMAADPPNVHFTWQFNSSIETLDLVAFNRTGLKSSSAFYTPRRLDDYGSLLCSANNSIGWSAAPCVFSIVPAGFIAGGAVTAPAPSPLLGTLIAAIALLVIIAILTIVIMGVKSSKRDRSGEGSEDVKSGTPVKIALDNIREVEEKCPDVIPPKSAGIGWAYASIHRQYSEAPSMDRIPSRDNIPSRSYIGALGTDTEPNCYNAMQDDEDVTCVELSPSTSSHSAGVRSGHRKRVPYRPVTDSTARLSQCKEFSMEIAAAVAERARCREEDANVRNGEKEACNTEEGQTPLAQEPQASTGMRPPRRPWPRPVRMPRKATSPIR